jgi:cystathionine beta-lyase/cystathionine gamma-synthase
MKFTTPAVHGDGRTGEASGDVVPAIHLATASGQPKPDEFQERVYPRGSNPTRLALEKRLALLEGARYAFAFSSGMAPPGWQTTAAGAAGRGAGAAGSANTP